MTISRIPLTPGRNRQRGQPQHIDLAFISGKIELILIALDDLVHKAILQRLLCGQPPARLQNIKNIIYLLLHLAAYMFASTRSNLSFCSLFSFSSSMSCWIWSALYCPQASTQLLTLCTRNRQYLEMHTFSHPVRQ